MNRVCVFCGSSPGSRAVYAEGAAQLGAELVRRKQGLVFGGGRVGLMGVIADAVLQAGGEAVGVMPQHLIDREIAHRELTQLHVVRSMHERKQMMADLADGFVLMPGGFGSWDEFCEVVTWAQLGIHTKPLGVLNVAGYYDALLALTERAVTDGFVREVHRSRIVVDSDPSALLDKMEHMQG